MYASILYDNIQYMLTYSNLKTLVFNDDLINNLQ